MGHGLALGAAGFCYEYGHGTSVDLKRAFEFYEKAVNHGESGYIGNLAECYEYGKGTARDLRKALELWERTGNEWEIWKCKDYIKNQGRYFSYRDEQYPDLPEYSENNNNVNMDMQAYLSKLNESENSVYKTYYELEELAFDGDKYLKATIKVRYAGDRSSFVRRFSSGYGKRVAARDKEIKDEVYDLDEYEINKLSIRYGGNDNITMSEIRNEARRNKEDAARSYVTEEEASTAKTEFMKRARERVAYIKSGYNVIATHNGKTLRVRTFNVVFGGYQ